jgi:hypothetical protein
MSLHAVLVGVADFRSAETQSAAQGSVSVYCVPSGCRGVNMRGGFYTNLAQWIWWLLWDRHSFEIEVRQGLPERLFRGSQPLLYLARFPDRLAALDAARRHIVALQSGDVAVDDLDQSYRGRWF